jgi:hypothetical protein
MIFDGRRPPRPRLTYWPGQRQPRRPRGGQWILLIVYCLAYQPGHPWSGLIAVAATVLLLIILAVMR